MSVIQFRRGAAAAWTAAHRVLASGEPGYETDTGVFKVGNGTDEWGDLDALGAGGGGGATLNDASTTTEGWTAAKIITYVAAALAPDETAAAALTTLTNSLRAVTDSTFVTNLKAILLARDWTMPGVDPATTIPALIIRQLGTITDTSVELIQIFNGTHKSYWHNEGGNPRSESYKGDQVAQKLFGFRGSGGQSANISEWYDVNGLLYAISNIGRPKIGPNGTNGNHIIVLAAAASVPSGLPANTLIARTVA